MVDHSALTWAFSAGDLDRITLRYWSPTVEASWTIDDEVIPDDPSLQIVYDRKVRLNGEEKHENYWLYFSPEDAEAIGKILCAWGAANRAKL